MFVVEMPNLKDFSLGMRLGMILFSSLRFYMYSKCPTKQLHKVLFYYMYVKCG